MATARPFNQPRSWDSPSYGAAKPAVEENEHEQQPIETNIGKIIFYVTVALGLWFFYWFNGIQCPC